MKYLTPVIFVSLAILNPGNLAADEAKTPSKVHRVTQFDSVPEQVPDDVESTEAEKEAKEKDKK